MADQHQPDYDIVYVGIAQGMHDDTVNSHLPRSYADDDMCEKKRPMPFWIPGPHEPGTTDGTPNVNLRWWFMGGGR